MWELEQQVENLVMQFLEESEAVYVNADQAGLDDRCGSIHISVNEDFYCSKFYKSNRILRWIRIY